MDEEFELRDKSRMEDHIFSSHLQRNRTTDGTDEGNLQVAAHSMRKAAKCWGRHFNEDGNDPEENHSRNKIPRFEMFDGRISNSEFNEREGSTGLGYKSLKIMIEKDLVEFAQQLKREGYKFNSLLEQKLGPDMIMSVVEMLAKVSKCPMNESKAAIITQSLKPNVLEMFSTHSCDMVTKDLKYTKDKVFCYFQNLSVFYEDVINLLPNTVTDVLKEHLIRAIMAIQSLKSMKNMTDLTELEQKFQELFFSVVSMIEAKTSDHNHSSKTKEIVKWRPPLTDFREISVLPSPQDVLSRSEVQLSPVIRNGPYQSVEHYLNVQFHLMREDFLIPLRRGIMNFIQQNSFMASRMKCIENVRFYKKVRFLGHMTKGDKIVSEFKFGIQGKMEKINWIRSKRILYGSLVCFSSDLFKTVFLGIITNRNIIKLKRGILECELLRETTEGDLFNKEFTMAESEVYFESYNHVLKALKLFYEGNFPFQDYIINASCKVTMPSYLERNQQALYKFGRKEFRVLDVTSWPNFSMLKINKSQFEALYLALTQKLVVIQGPPGTGKTYLGLIITKLLLENCAHWRNWSNKGPILVVCYTNHALDQFLEGILSFTENIVRIGGQSKSEKLEMYNLKKIRKNTTVAKGFLNEIEKELKECVEEINNTSAIIQELSKKSGIISLDFLKIGMSDQHFAWFNYDPGKNDSLLMDWLLYGADFENNNVTNCTDIEPITKNMRMMYACNLIKLKTDIEVLQNGMTDACYDEDKGRRLEFFMNVFLYIKRKLMELVCQKRSLVNRLLITHNLWSIHPADRWILYDYWVSETIEYYGNIFSEQKIKYQQLNKQKLNILDTVNVETISQLNIVGMTTTGAAKHQTLLRKLGAKIVIVEEAAEIMESHVVVSLTEKCEHLILIGDHKQLRPKTSEYKLAKDYNLDVSLFERMLDNGVPCSTLKVQHRMRPEIAELIIPAIYPALENHETVLIYENIMGLNKNVYFITHSNVEQSAMDDCSKKNSHEARFLIALCRHIVLQGYDPTQITILTTYIGQMFYLMEERDKSNIIKNVRISVVDNYQGEENDIILLSLVRNNTEGKIGFLGIENRVCVALSRAKKGLYIMGNIEMLSAKSTLWCKIKGTLEKNEAIGTHLTLHCSNHPAQLTKVCKAEDFISITEGGCMQICDTKLDCGHNCKRICHMMGHGDYKCNEACKKTCANGHRCKKLCWEKCIQCTVPLEQKLPCGHMAILPCHTDASKHICHELVNIELPKCDHTISKKCYVDLKDVICSFPCEYRPSCGHICARKCHINVDPEHLEYKCLRQCGRNNLNCKYGHRCTKKCYEECEVCKVMVEKEIPDCKHKITIECQKTPERQMCRMKCERRLSCGHSCQNLCGLPCSGKECRTWLKETIKAPCGHQVRLRCHERNKVPDPESIVKRCQEACSTVLECGHKCKGTCLQCMQGRIHELCQEKCGRILICEHSCEVTCAQSCPPCMKNCYTCCIHSKCNLKCGYPCSPCKENCEWKCEHLECHRLCGELCDRPPCEEPCKKILSCQHPCIGFCGEKCPKLCRICDSVEIEDILSFLGSEEDVENARFVVLPDCKHIFDSKGLDKWMSMDGNGVKMKLCPVCRTPIQNAYRYRNITKQSFMNVLKVKEKCFGVGRDSFAIVEPYNKLSSLIKKGLEFQKSKGSLQKLDNYIKLSFRKKFDAFILNSLEARIKLVLSIVESYSNMKNKVHQMSEYHENADSLISIILKRLDLISPQEHDDLTCEYTRFHLKLQLGAVEATSGFKTFFKGEWFKTYERCKELVYSLRRFPRNSYEETHNKIDKIYKLLTKGSTISLTKVDMNGIVRALNLHQGHWILCPNGHVYVIDHCGGTMEEGRCNECGERIGGTHHQLISTNRRLNSIPEGL